MRIVTDYFDLALKKSAIALNVGSNYVILCLFVFCRNSII